MILVLARGMKKRWELEIEKAIKDNRLLVVCPFNNDTKRVTRETAEKRNEKIIEISDEIMIGYKTENGQLDKLLKEKEYELL